MDNSNPMALPIAGGDTVIWTDFIENVKARVSERAYITWFKPLVPAGLDGNILTVRIPNSIFYDFITERYREVVDSSLVAVLGPGANIIYEIEDPNTVTVALDVPPEPRPLPKPYTPPVEMPSHQTGLNPIYTFDNFIRGNGNELAYATAHAIVFNPGGSMYNPYFLYGGVGLGKTHLAQAIGNKIQSQYPAKKVIFTSGDEFTVQFVESIKQKRAEEFSAFYRSMDVLIIDDIQFLTGKEATQDLFFHIFNTLHQGKKQLILTSDKPPKEIKGMTERLLSRFVWGMTADIQPPDFETRMAIIEKKAENYGLTIDPKVVEYLARNVTSNVRELEGCLLRLMLNASISSSQINMEMTKKVVTEISFSRKITIGIDLITKLVSEEFAVDENKLRDKTRKQEVAIARQVAMYLSKQMMKTSLKNIGLHFGGRDHTTVMHAISTVEELISANFEFASQVQTIREKIELACY